MCTSRREINISIFVISLVLSCGTVGNSVKIAINLSNCKPLWNVPKEYLSFSLDTALIYRHWGGIVWWKAVILARALSPAFLRVGGTRSDMMLFQDIRINDTSHHSSSFGDEGDPGATIENRPLTNFTMTATDMDRLSAFARWCNLSIIFQLNSFLRTPNGDWDWRANTASLLDYAQRHRVNLNFQIGNEPDLYFKFNRTLSPAQLAKDYAVLKSVLQRDFPFYKNSLLTGPQIANAQDGYLEQFVQAGAYSSVDALTFHQYYFDGRLAKKQDFMDPSVLDILVGIIQSGKDIIAKYIPQRRDFPFWLDETSTGFAGGAPGLSDAFIATFMWLDKLGLCALHGVSLVSRQSLFGNSYSLLDQNTNPRPDYWISLLHKRFVGPTVMKLDITVQPEYQNYTRFYGHCGHNRTTIFGMNLLNDSLTVSLLPESATFYFYMLSAPNADLLSKSIKLNGQVLKFDGFRIPKLKGIKMKSRIVMPPDSLAFLVFEQRGCQV